MYLNEYMKTIFILLISLVVICASFELSLMFTMTISIAMLIRFEECSKSKEGGDLNVQHIILEKLNILYHGIKLGKKYLMVY